MTLTGTVVRFDDVKGYGFITPEAGGDDIFVHANDLKVSKLLVKSGLQVVFEVETGERGKLARNVHASDQGGANDRIPLSSGVVDADANRRRIPLGVFLRECTEMIIESAPGVSGEDIARIRQGLVVIAESHDWVGR